MKRILLITILIFNVCFIYSQTELDSNYVQISEPVGFDSIKASHFIKAEELNMLGIKTQQEHRHNEAITIFNNALSISPEDSLTGHIYVNRGWSYYELGNYRQTISDMNRVLKYEHGYKNQIKVESIDALRYRAESYAELNILDSAEVDMKLYLSFRKNDYEALLNYAYLIKEKQGDYASSVDIYTEILKMSPQNLITNLYNNRAYAFCKLNKFEDALKDVEKSLSINSNSAWAYKIRAIIYYSMKKNREACIDIKKSINLNYIGLYGNDILELENIYCK